MKNLNEISFQVYHQPITNTIPMNLISLEWMIRLTQKQTTQIIDVFDQIADAERSGNMTLKAELKLTHLLFFTPCVVVNPKRNYASITRFTGLMVLDFDHIDMAVDFKTFLFNKYKCLIAVWLSPSKRGVKALVKIPIVNTVDEFKEYYYGIAAEMELYNGFDSSGQNPVLPLLQSYDPELLYRDDPDTWTIKGRKRNDFPKSRTWLGVGVSLTDKNKQNIIKNITTGFDSLLSFGHPTLRSLCICIGGYIAGGDITEEEAMLQISSKIESHYYQKKGYYGL